MTTLEIKDIAGVHDIVVDIPEDSGGVLVFKGRNGAGKSACIEIVRGLLSSERRKLACRDGAAKGKASGFGREVSVGQTTRYRGEAEAASLEGRFDFSDLVVPAAKDEETRDRIRIKALLSLTGAKSEPALFYALVGGKERFEQLVPADAVKKADDLVELGARVAAALHAEARKRESDASYAESHAQACRAAAGDVDQGLKVNIDELHEASQKATAEHSRLEERRKQAEDNRATIEDCERKLEQVQASYEGVGVKEATEGLEAATKERQSAESKVQEIERQLADAKAVLNSAKTQQLEARAAYDRAVAYESMVSQLQEQINTAAGGEDPPSDLDVKMAAKAAESAKHKLEQAIRQRDAILKAVEAEGHEKTAKEHRKAADALREAARSVDQVLTTKLPPGPLRAEKGRLVLDTDRGEGVPFDECSQGEKYRVALPYGIKSVGEGGYLALIQEGWDGLDAEHRAEIADLCRKSHVWLITGEVDEGELRAETFALEA